MDIRENINNEKMYNDSFKCMKNINQFKLMLHVPVSHRKDTSMKQKQMHLLGFLVVGGDKKGREEEPLKNTHIHLSYMVLNGKIKPLLLLVKQFVVGKTFGCVVCEDCGVHM